MRTEVMGAISLSLLLASFTAWPAFAKSCTGAEAELARVSKALTVNALDIAENTLRTLIASYPDCPDIVLHQARLAQAKGNISEASELYYRYTDTDPDDSRGLAYFGRFFLEQRDYMRADALSAAAVDKNPDDPNALALRGQILLMKGQSSEGQSLLEKAIKLDPDDPETQFQLGTIYDKAKVAARAVEHFRKAATLNPHDARAWDYLALNLELVGDLDGTEQAYQKGLQMNQAGRYHDAFLDYNYGRFLARRNDLSGSKRHLDRAVESAPQVRAVWYERAKLDMRMQNFQQARADAEKAAACTQQGGIIDLQIYSLLSQVYARLGDTALAKKYTDLTRETPPPIRGEQR
jgi:tetratricopeptide (TPR) repeat protein